jgi:hypothetical protein
MPVTLMIAPGVELTVDDAGAARLLDQLTAVTTDGATDSAVLDEEHPLWDRHSGGAGHGGPEWTDADTDLADAFYAPLRGKAKLFFDLLLDRPGRQLTVDDLVGSSNGALTSSFSVAGAINGLRLPHEKSGRRYPFYWWEGTPSRYAVKSSVAAVFNSARARAAS